MCVYHSFIIIMIVMLVYTCSQVYCMIIQYVQCVSSGRGFSVWVGVILTFYLFILFCFNG